MLREIHEEPSGTSLHPITQMLGQSPVRRAPERLAVRVSNFLVKSVNLSDVIRGKKDVIIDLRRSTGKNGTSRECFNRIFQTRIAFSTLWARTSIIVPC